MEEICEGVMLLGSAPALYAPAPPRRMHPQETRPSALHPASRALLTPCIGDCGMRTGEPAITAPACRPRCRRAAIAERPGCRPALGQRLRVSSRPASDVCGMPADAVGIALALAARSPAVLADGCAHGSRTISVRKWRANGKKHGRRPGLRPPLFRSPRTATRPDSGHRLPDTGRRTPASASRVRNQERQQS